MQNIDMLKEGLHEQEETLGVLSTALFSAKPAKHVKTRQTHEPQQTGTMGITCWDAGVFILQHILYCINLGDYAQNR